MPEGFTATIFHPGLGATRHIAVRDNGDVYIAREFRIERKMFGQEAAWGALIAMVAFQEPIRPVNMAGMLVLVAGMWLMGVGK